MLRASSMRGTAPVSSKRSGGKSRQEGSRRIHERNPLLPPHDAHLEWWVRSGHGSRDPRSLFVALSRMSNTDAGDGFDRPSCPAAKTRAGSHLARLVVRTLAHAYRLSDVARRGSRASGALAWNRIRTKWTSSFGLGDGQRSIEARPPRKRHPCRVPSVRRMRTTDLQRGVPSLSLPEASHAKSHHSRTLLAGGERVGARRARQDEVAEACGRSPPDPRRAARRVCRR